jgi:hypothetical protein
MAPFAYAEKQAEILFWLIFCERKTLFQLKSTNYKPAEQGHMYDWDDDMENLLWGRGLNSCMQLFFAEQTISYGVLSCHELSKGHMIRGEGSRRTWNDMKAVLQCRFGNGTNLLDIKPIVLTVAD